MQILYFQTSQRLNRMIKQTNYPNIRKVLGIPIDAHVFEHIDDHIYDSIDVVKSTVKDSIWYHIRISIKRSLEIGVKK